MEGCPKPSIAILKPTFFHYGLGKSWIAGLHAALGTQPGPVGGGTPQTPKNTNGSAFGFFRACGLGLRRSQAPETLGRGPQSKPRAPM